MFGKALAGSYAGATSTLKPSQTSFRPAYLYSLVDPAGQVSCVVAQSGVTELTVRCGEAVWFGPTGRS